MTSDFIVQLFELAKHNSVFAETLVKIGFLRIDFTVKNHFSSKRYGVIFRIAKNKLIAFKMIDEQGKRLL